MSDHYEFPRTFLKQLRRAARKADLHEICYAVFGRGKTIRRIIRIPNRSKDKMLNHTIWNEDFLNAKNRVRDLRLRALGLLHTHPVSPAAPSHSDIKGYEKGALIFIYGTIYRELRAFRITKTKRGYLEKPIVIVDQAAKVRHNSL